MERDHRIPLEDRQLGPDPVISERARHMGVDYATADLEDSFERGMHDYIHTGHPRRDEALPSPVGATRSEWDAQLRLPGL